MRTRDESCVVAEHLPDMELLREIRRLNSSINVPMMMGYLPEDENVLSMEQCSVEWLQKPFTTKDLTQGPARLRTRGIVVDW